MIMIKRNDLFHIEFYKHTCFNGSWLGMRYRIEKTPEEEGAPLLRVTVFPGPYGFDATPEDRKISSYFPFSNEGLDQICTYLNDTYESSPERWAEGLRIL